MNPTLDVNTPDGAFKAYIARPAILPAPAVVVVQEIFGVNADLRDTCDELARQGYFALSPDLFWRMEPGVDLSDQTEAEWKKGFALYTAFDYPSGVSDIAATLQVARTLVRRQWQGRLDGLLPRRLDDLSHHRSPRRRCLCRLLRRQHRETSG